MRKKKYNIAGSQNVNRNIVIVCITVRMCKKSTDVVFSGQYHLSVVKEAVNQYSEPIFSKSEHIGVKI